MLVGYLREQNFTPSHTCTNIRKVRLSPAGPGASRAGGEAVTARLSEAAFVPITDGNQEVFGSRGEKLKVGNVQLLDLDGLAELNDEPERGENEQTHSLWVLRRERSERRSCDLPDFVATRVEHVQVHVLHQNG